MSSRLDTSFKMVHSQKNLMKCCMSKNVSVLLHKTTDCSEGHSPNYDKGLWKTSEQRAGDKTNRGDDIFLKCAERQGLVCVGLEAGCVKSRTVRWC